MKNVYMPSRLLAIATICAFGVLAVGLPGCDSSTSQNDQQIRQKSADATRDVQRLFAHAGRGCPQGRCGRVLASIRPNLVSSPLRAANRSGGPHGAT